MIALSRCPVCAGERTEPEQLGLVRCPDCGTVRAREYADPEAVFVDGYFTGGAGPFGIDISHPRFRAYVLEVGHQRMETIERFAPARGGSLLDVGCGTGELVRAASERGWQATGVEPMPEAAAGAREIWDVDVRTAMLEDSGLPERSFDVVCAFHVLEHVPDSPAFLSLLARWARPGGLVVAESPNWDSERRRASGTAWIHLRPGEHLVHFTPATMSEAARRAGLEPLATFTPAQLSREHTLQEALGNLGRPQWERRLRRLPRRARWWALDRADRRFDRRGVGPVVQLITRTGGRRG